MVKAIAIVTVLFVAGTLLASCSSGPAAGIRGKYANENQDATLEITSDKMVGSLGPLTITADYKVLSVAGADVTVELTAPDTPRDNMVVTVSDKSLVIKDNFLFGGTWTRK